MSDETNTGSYRKMTELLDAMHEAHETLPKLTEGATRETEALSRMLSGWQSKLIVARLWGAEEYERLTRERDEARALRAASDRVLASGVVVSTEKYADLVQLAGGDVSLLDELHNANARATAATARVEALEKALRQVAHAWGLPPERPEDWWNGVLLEASTSNASTDVVLRRREVAAHAAVCSALAPTLAADLPQPPAGEEVPS